MKKIYENVKLYRLANSNSKLGKSIWSFDLPAVKTCPNCDDCKDTCYALKAERMYKQTRNYRQVNYELALNHIKVLEQLINRQINEKKIKYVRIHSSGDFFSYEYFLMWCRIAKANPDVRFFTYTKTGLYGDKNIPKNFNIKYSYVKHNTKRYLNYGKPEYVNKLAKEVKHPVCPATSGKQVKCEDCKLCMYSKKTPLFYIH